MNKVLPVFICFVLGWVLTFFLHLSQSYGQGVSSDTESVKAVALLNEIRQKAGLAPVAISDSLSKACAAHTEYLFLNRNSRAIAGLAAHNEQPSLPGYTIQGEKAGKRAVIHFVDPFSAIDGWIRTLYHRIPLLQPGLKNIGIAYLDRDGYQVCLIDCLSGLSGETSTEFVCYPGKNQKDVPLRMGPEIPPPVKYPTESGFPVTIYFAKEQRISQVYFTLTNGNNDTINCQVSTPEKPATYFSQWNTVCAIPVNPLQANTLYNVSLSCVVNGQAFSLKYSFQTGSVR